MPEITVSDRLYEKLEEQTEEEIEDALWDMMHQTQRGYH